MDILRTLLFVPGNRQRMLERGPSAGADALVIDLEDAVPASEKREARALVRALLPRLVEAGQPVYVRVNATQTGLTRADLLALVRPGLAGVVHPKTDAPQDLRDLDVLLREAETKNNVRPGDTAVIPLIESPRAVLRLPEIALAIDRVVALSVGGEDYATAMGVERDGAGVALAHVRYTVATVAAANGMLAIDTPYANMKDERGLVVETALVKEMGFKGKYVIHPDQVAVVNRIMSPAPEEVTYARRVIKAAGDAARVRRGSTSLDGRMIDTPIIDRARSVLELAARIDALRAPVSRRT